MRIKLIQWLIGGIKGYIPADDLGTVLQALSRKLPDEIVLTVNDLSDMYDCDVAWDGLEEFAVEGQKSIRMLN